MTFSQFLTSWHAQNAVVGLLVVFMTWLVARLSRRAYWRMAFRQVFERRLVRSAFAMLCLYTLVALLDSVGFYPATRDDRGQLLVHEETGRVLKDSRGLSVLDWFCTPLRAAREKTYSAPLAARQFTREAMLDDRGAVVRAYPALVSPGRHLLGTDRVGNDVLYMALKGVRTGMIIGAFTTLLVIPFAIAFGVTAGYFGGWVDDAIVFVYTVLSSIPSVLLIVAFMIVIDAKFPEMSRLTALCAIMGLTSWTGLCRVLRGETMKLRESEYVQAAQAIGASRAAIMLRHIVPNVMHIVLITAVLSFSGLVLAEAVLTYLGIGVGAETFSWGTMINAARQELARDPIVWWNLAAAFLFMLGLVLPANLFGDAVRDALDPRLRVE